MSKIKFTTKDAIQIGIYTAIYFVVSAVAGSIGYIPILYPLAPFLIAVVGGPIFFFFLRKVNHFGMITLLSTLCGAILALTGHGIYSLLAGVVIGLLADYICYKGDFRTFRTILFSYAIFSLTMASSFFPMLLAADSFYKDIGSMMSEEYASELQTIMQDWVFILVFVGAFVGGLIGAFLGRAVTRKRFSKGEAFKA
ncbi:MAG: MptD family putative ECF transporter S component [Clostridiaceae bacterium]|jgi:energy-coupling factor transport system substrate-specific component|nr:MptD family putative ECF transporter S component [Bacillota bacterium]NLN51934.1 MptD family putative ECF transporter S component [Clostridiaceae bacterium]